MKRWCLLEIDFPVSAVTQFEEGGTKAQANFAPGYSANYDGVE